MTSKKATKSNAIVLLSGGIDSSACAYLFRQKGYAVCGVFIDYGQAAAKPEKNAAKVIAARMGIPLAAYRVQNRERFPAGELMGRNAFLLFTAIFLSRLHSGLIVIGVHSGTSY